MIGYLFRVFISSGKFFIVFVKMFHYWCYESLESKKEKHAFWILISDFHNMDHDEYVEDDLGSSVSSYTDEVQLSRSMENGNFTCGL